MQFQSFLRAFFALAVLGAADAALAQAADTTRRVAPAPEVQLRALAAQALNPQALLVAVPDVTRLDEASARERLARVRLGASRNEQTSDRVAPGTVLAQDPRADTRVKPGTAVRLTIATAPSTVWLPSFVGQPEDVARRSLQDLGGSDNPARLRVLGEIQASSAPARSVVRQFPANRNVPRGSTVTLHVSDGSLVIVPSVQGLDERTARERLRAAGLGSDRQEAVTADRPAGEVFLQEPAAKTEVRRGTGVMLTIAVALPPALIWVPSYVGRQEEEALSALRRLGAEGTTPALQVRSVERQSVAPAGRVLAQQPEKQNVRRGTLVTLQVSDGSLVKVPEVRQFTQAEAVSRLARGGLRATTETEISAQHVPGRVFAQTPPPNEQVARDSQVTITVAAAVPAPQPTPDGAGPGGTGGAGPTSGSGPGPSGTVTTPDAPPAADLPPVRAWYEAPWALLLTGIVAGMLGMGIVRALRRARPPARKPVEPRVEAPMPKVHAEWRGPAARPALSAPQGEPVRLSVTVSALRASEAPHAFVQRREEETSHA